MTEEIRAFRKRYPNWPAEMLAGFFAGLLASTLLVAFLAWQSDWVATKTLEANPTCESPRGLTQVAVAEASGASEEHHRDVGGTVDGLSFYAPARAVDGVSLSLWIPPLLEPLVTDVVEESRVDTPRFDTTDGQNVLRLDLAEDADVRLVCVMNGATLWYTSYQNWGRVRTVRVWGEDPQGASETILRSLGPEEYTGTQQAARGVGRTSVVHIALVDAYAGQRVETFNARACLAGATARDGGGDPFERNRESQPFELAPGVIYRYEPGCILQPKNRAGLAEVYLYADQ